ncbi:unnamed protein product [Bursaphelenchus xylophilus]|uniref:(pine wood nematode) hypothetical protein n=1 Tax=Bursaphelenchus xylophilus TaxID=6326 RepID=A0A1I7SVV1_BURXY|nr:unnamed protein product [Bursaphelenchus xylophilus]CAG9098318.1 unnamed protein product [Bursaphelenchus xylophilus]
MQEEDEELPAPSQHVHKTTNIASLYALRAELLTKKNQVKSIGLTRKTLDIGKHSILTISKKDKELKEDGKKRRLARIEKLASEIRKEEEERERRKKVLEEKAKIYERLTSGERLVNEDGRDVEFLVNFNVKKREIEERREKEEEDREQKRSRFEEDEIEVPEIEPERLFDRYNPMEEPGRLFGPSHAVLPTGEEERTEKIKEIKDMSKKTEETRAKRKKILTEKKRAEKEKLQKFRARMNLSPLPSTSEESEEEYDVPGPSLADIPLPPEPQKAAPVPKNQTSYGIREWDEGKWYRKWKEDQERRRDDEFAPPKFYRR